MAPTVLLPIIIVLHCPMPKSSEDLFKLLDSLEIKHRTYKHQPISSAEEAQEWKDQTPGLHCKNLFIEDKSGRMFLVTMPAFERANLSLISSRLKCGRFSFVKADKMPDILGVPAGHATPFVFINESAKVVQSVLDVSVLNAELINIHPLINSASTVISGKDLAKFLRHSGQTPAIIATFE